MALDKNSILEKARRTNRTLLTAKIVSLEAAIEGLNHANPPLKHLRTSLTTRSSSRIIQNLEAAKVLQVAHLLRRKEAWMRLPLLTKISRVTPEAPLFSWE